MVEFGKQLATSRRQEWNEFYIEYDSLKKILKKGMKKKKKKPTAHNEDGTGGDASSSSHKQKKNASHSDFLDLSQSLQSIEVGGISDHIVMPTTNKATVVMSDDSADESTFAVGYLAAIEFRQTLDQNIEKLVLFLLQEEGLLASQLYQLSQRRNVLRDDVASLLYDYSAIVVSSSSTTATSSSSVMWKIRDIEDTSKGCMDELKQQTNNHRAFAQSLVRLSVRLPKIPPFLRLHGSWFVFLFACLHCFLILLSSSSTHKINVHCIV
jgi:hypothetical protein